MSNKPAELFQLHISLLDIAPPIWRRLLVVSDLPLDFFHNALQCAMGWENDHMHLFRKGKQTYLTPEDIDLSYRDKAPMPETDFALRDLLPRVGSTFDYLYDFGDDWWHRIVLEKRLPLDHSIPTARCIVGERACPPEDCGGTWRYQAILRALADPQHPEHEDVLEWMGYDPIRNPKPWDAEAFDLDKANACLQGAFPN
jgi:hypothetical protein